MSIGLGVSFLFLVLSSLIQNNLADIKATKDKINHLIGNRSYYTAKSVQWVRFSAILSRPVRDEMISNLSAHRLRWYILTALNFNAVKKYHLSRCVEPIIIKKDHCHSHLICIFCRNYHNCYPFYCFVVNLSLAFNSLMVAWNCVP